jgi:hypothetical protein
MINNSNENTLMDDANSYDVNKVLLGEVSEDFIKVSDTLKEAAYQIKKRGFSDYPVFVATQQVVSVGQVLFNAGELNGNQFGYKASMLEEFLQRELIAIDSVDLFKENYKNMEEYCCLFVVKDDFAGFVYVPYPED